MEAEVHLPPLTKEIVLLPLEPMQLRTYNLIQSTIVTNAVDSERRDEDYIFHPKVRLAMEDMPATHFIIECQIFAGNIYKLIAVSGQTELIHLSYDRFRSLFWHADAEFFDTALPDHLNNSAGSIRRAIERGRASLEDLVLLKQANNIQ